MLTGSCLGSLNSKLHNIQPARVISAAVHLRRLSDHVDCLNRSLMAELNGDQRLPAAQGRNVYSCMVSALWARLTWALQSFNSSCDKWHPDQACICLISVVLVVVVVVDVGCTEKEASKDIWSGMWNGASLAFNWHQNQTSAPDVVGGAGVWSPPADPSNSTRN